ncbi:alpha/beta fold hydrolase [Kribbella sp. NPDC048928]|uniref:alpha/beta fold hydrolase n=1 Tax=Kribbella sp. NPDC048928 TaxID=3364111 RepID=UPI00371DB923
MELTIPVGQDSVWAEHLAGDGVPIVLLPPGTGDSRVWDLLVPGLDGRRVLRYDVRGYGRSPLPTTEFSLLEDLETVLDQLALEKVLLVGCSMGGSTALSEALAHPDRVHGLVLLSPDVPGFPMPPEPDLVAHDDVMSQYLKADAPVYERLGEIRVPAVVMVGDKDRPILAAVAGATAARIPGCEFTWMPGADHLSSLRDPQLVTETVLRFAS